VTAVRSGSLSCRELGRPAFVSVDEVKHRFDPRTLFRQPRFAQPSPEHTAGSVPPAAFHQKLAPDHDLLFTGATSVSETPLQQLLVRRSRLEHLRRENFVTDAEKANAASVKPGAEVRVICLGQPACGM